MSKNLLSLTEKLIRFETIQRNPLALRKCADFIVHYFSDLKLHKKIITKNNIPTVFIATRKTQSPKILLHGHFDVVDTGSQNSFKAKIVNDRLYGRGASDMKGGLAVMMSAFRSIVEKKPQSDIGIMFHGDEEVGSKDGAEYLVEKLGYRTDLLINFDGGLNETISHAEKGIMRLRFQANTKNNYPVHNPWKGSNAIDDLMQSYYKFQKLFPNKKKATEQNNWHTTYTVWQMSSKNHTSYSAHVAEMLLSMHFVENRTVQEYLEYLRKSLPEISIELLLGVERVFVPKNNKYIRHWQNIMEKEFGKTIPIRAENGSSDARFFSRFRIPMIIVTVTRDGQHTDHEYLDIHSLEPFKNTLTRFLLETHDKKIQKVS